MKQDFLDIIWKYQERKIDKTVFIEEIESKLKIFNIKELFNEIMMEKNNSDLEDALTIFWVIDSNDDVLDILNELLLQNWHTRHEEIIHSIQKISSPKSIRYIKEAMQINFQYLEDYGTGLRQFINQCGHALLSIGTKEAIELIYELSESKNQILKDEMLYRINKMNGKDDYKRNYNLI